MMTNKGRSAAVRAEIKKLGYSSKQVSVRSGYCGYSDYTHITVKDVKANIKEIEKACKKFQSIDYDMASGEILEGGNTYIHVQYDYSAMNDAIKNELPKVNSIIADLETIQKHIKKDNLDFVIFKQGNTYCMTCHENNETCGTLKIRPTENVEQFKYLLAQYFATDFNYN